MPPLARRGSGEMADTPVLGTGAPACGFKSRLPHTCNNFSLGNLLEVLNFFREDIYGETIKGQSQETPIRGYARCS